MPTEARVGHAVVWVWQCTCGEVVEKPANWVVSGNTKSCGCLQKEWSKKSLLTHGKTGHPLHKVWRSMRGRCSSPNNKAFPNYGGRGIYVDPEWDDFLIFYNWAMDNGYKKGLSIERIDVNGNYTPSNCKWIELKFQARNRRSSKLNLDAARKIRRDPRTNKEIGCNYGVSAALVGQIKRGLKWKEPESTVRRSSL
jgi:hypothetical protein